MHTAVSSRNRGGLKSPFFSIADEFISFFLLFSVFSLLPYSDRSSASSRGDPFWWFRLPRALMVRDLHLCEIGARPTSHFSFFFKWISFQRLSFPPPAALSLINPTFHSLLFRQKHIEIFPYPQFPFLGIFVWATKLGQVYPPFIEFFLATHTFN